MAAAVATGGHRWSGILGTVLCLTVSLTALVSLTGASLVANYTLIAIAALFGRPTGATAHNPHKMPLGPVPPPIIALTSLGYISPSRRSYCCGHPDHRQAYPAGVSKHLRLDVI